MEEDFCFFLIFLLPFFIVLSAFGRSPTRKLLIHNFLLCVIGFAVLAVLKNRSSISSLDIFPNAYIQAVKNITFLYNVYYISNNSILQGFSEVACCGRVTVLINLLGLQCFLLFVRVFCFHCALSGPF